MNYNIALIKGDGIGPEISDETVKVLRTIERLYNHKFNIKEVLGAGQAVDKYNTPLPKLTIDTCIESDAVIIGNVGLSKYNNVEMNLNPVKLILDLRKILDISTNLRPITINQNLTSFSPLKESIISKGMDILVVRDLLGSVICGEKKNSIGENGREASDLEYYNEEMIKKSAKLAFESSLDRKKKVSSIEKSNVLASSRLWKEVVKEESKAYEGVVLTNHLVDTAAMELILKPYEFDVVVTTNMFGDILADELSQISGIECMLPSAEINDNKKGIYTPNQLHHPDESIINKNIANPIGLISSAALMLRYSLDLPQEATLIEEAINEAINRGYRTYDIYKDGYKLVNTNEMGDIISECIEELFNKSKLNKAS